MSVLIGKQSETAEQHVERLEMAQIKLEAAIETSRGWHIRDASLLRWRRKLKRAAQECDDTLRQCKQRAVEDEAREQEVRGASFPRRLAHAAKSLFRRDGSLAASSAAAVRRFEWLAGGAGEFRGSWSSAARRAGTRSWTLSSGTSSPARSYGT